MIKGALSETDIKGVLSETNIEELLAIIALTIDYTATQFDFKFKLPSTKSVILHWGDGMSEEVVGEDGTEITKTSSYAGAGEYRFWLSGDVTEITYIYLYNILMDITCDMSRWSALTSLTDLTILNTITLSGALPVSLTYLHLDGDNVNWTYSGALPTGIVSLRFNGPNINWTGLDIGDTGDIDYFGLLNYRIAKMSSSDMITLLTQMTGRTGSLPATVTINDFQDYAAPPSEVTDAVAALKAAKSITSVSLGA